MNEPTDDITAVAAIWYIFVALGVAAWHYHHTHLVIKAMLVGVLWPSYLIYRLALWILG